MWLRPTYRSRTLGACAEAKAGVSPPRRSSPCILCTRYTFSLYQASHYSRLHIYVHQVPVHTWYLPGNDQSTSLARVTKSYLLALGTTQTSSPFFFSAWSKKSLSIYSSSLPTYIYKHISCLSCEINTSLSPPTRYTLIHICIYRYAHISLWKPPGFLYLQSQL